MAKHASQPRRSDSTPRELRPAACAENQTGPTGKQAAQSKRGDSQPIASEEDCLRALSQLPGLIAMGILTNSNANSIRGVYSTLLGHHQKVTSGRSNQQLDDENVLDILRQKPELLSMLEPLLTEEQVSMVMSAEADSGDG